MSVCDKYFHFAFNITRDTSSDFLQKLQISGEVFSPPEPSRAKFTPSGRVFRLSRPLAWTLHSRTTCGNICWSWSWIIPTSPSKGLGLGSTLAACSVYGDLTRSVHTVNILSSVSNYQTHVCLCIWGPYVRLLSSWNKVIIISVLGIFPQMRIWHKNKK